jgi:hypothetical protein
VSTDDTTRRGGKQDSLDTSAYWSGQAHDLPASSERNHNYSDYPDIPWPDTSRGVDAQQICVTDLLSREGKADDQAQTDRSPGLYPVVAIATGLLLLCGAIVSSVVAVSSPHVVRSAPTMTASAVTGANALSPEVINSSFGTMSSSSAPPGPPAVGGGAGTAASTAALTPAPGKDPVLSTVLDFYQAVTVAPRDAFDMLAPSMRGPGYPAFQHSWAGVKRVSVDNIRRDGPDTAAVTVSTERADGSMLRSLQVVRVVPGSPPQIVDARLLSASRS